MTSWPSQRLECEIGAMYAYVYAKCLDLGGKPCAEHLSSYLFDVVAPTYLIRKDHPKARLVRALSFLGFGFGAPEGAPPLPLSTADSTPAWRRTAERPRPSSDPASGSLWPCAGSRPGCRWRRSGSGTRPGPVPHGWRPGRRSRRSGVGPGE